MGCPVRRNADIFDRPIPDTPGASRPDGEYSALVAIRLVRSAMGSALAALQRFDEAEPHLTTALETLRAGPGADPAGVCDARESVAALLDATGRTLEADRVRAGRLD